ncbi:MAG: LysR family transcriptional regulator [Candidatus Desulfofervidus auxilii]|nr:LysR family transcriptional regulator [Candidatus Desulfofervidus auxilii]
MLYFDLFSIKAFLTIVELGSFSKAAERLFVTQPAISARIKALEQLLGVKLIKRSHDGITLTEAGRKLYSYAKKLEIISEQLIKELSHYQMNKKTILIGSTVIPGKYWLPKIICTFSKKYPEVSMKLKICSNNEIIKQVLKRKIDLGITSVIPYSHKILYKKIACCELTLIAPSNYPKKEISLSELTREFLVMREDDSGVTVCFRNFCKRHGLDLNRLKISMILDCNESIKFAVKEGKGIGIVPKCTVLLDVKEDSLKMIKLKEGILKYDRYLIYLPDKLTFPSIKNFCKFLEQNTPQVIKNFYNC